MNRETTEEWTFVTKKKPIISDFLIQKIHEPCWFFNNGGCKNPDGTKKFEVDCKYQHILSENAKRPTHLYTMKPCDKHNLEGYCKWDGYCKYSHRDLTQEEWGYYYPNIPYMLKTNNQKRQITQIKIYELESRIKILEYKFKRMDEYYEERFNRYDNILKN